MLEFVIAGSGAGKTYHVCNEIINKSIENPDGNYIIIVPEQYTLQTQKEMVRLHPANGILNIDVLSLLRLAYRVFDELGKKNNIVLEDTGKSMILRKVMELKKDELRIFRNSIRKQGFVSEMKSVISELYQYSVTPDKLEYIINHIEDNSNMVNKFSELLIIYKGFKEYLQNKYITNEEVLDILCDIIDES
ncbi:MAG: hypothetical protein K6G26_04090, partial [Lachnospiraceae bacterium]|nr:hypothetical protein [Lachnospiraceae bacterium]